MTTVDMAAAPPTITLKVMERTEAGTLNLRVPTTAKITERRGAKTCRCHHHIRIFNSAQMTKSKAL